MPDESSPTLFWIALSLTVAGMLLTLAATAVVAKRALRDRSQWESKVETGKSIAQERERAHGRLAAELAHVAQARRFAQQPSLHLNRPLDESDKGAINRKYDAKFEAAVGRKPSSFTYADQLVLPELMALAITREQIAELKWPAALVAAGVIISTAGSIVSLWA
ncbi:hypothetical protein [Aeromicrobium wangtongii]|uniref:hypothetical protein n=1 Tax=Aeromicrobium wangtongii TaxID=2969247 RepID=UPI0020183232|nr:hypothetical protein [Aeromicrobium wangtongii]MCL3818397.1 hypothetical protein [Aeromicrobium wangtongii]